MFFVRNDKGFGHPCCWIHLLQIKQTEMAVQFHVCSGSVLLEITLKCFQQTDVTVVRIKTSSL